MKFQNARRFEGKVAVVTGAARGQGRAIAVRLAEEGADIIAIDSCRSISSTTYPAATSAELVEVGRLVEKEGRRVVAVEADVRDFEALKEAIDTGADELGRLDVVVANAGVLSSGRSWELDLAQWQDVIDVNLTGVFHTAKATVPILIEQSTGGSIVMTSSVAGLRGLPFISHYSASKHGVVGLCRAMASELAGFNIRVNTIHPFAVRTGMDDTDLPALLEQHSETLAPIFMGSLPDTISEPDDIADAVAWLASDEARHVTGIQLPIDLGTLTR